MAQKKTGGPYGEAEGKRKDIQRQASAVGEGKKEPGVTHSGEAQPVTKPQRPNE